MTQRLRLKLLICGSHPGLNYCCMWAFFSLYRRTQQIADRLGCTTRAVKKQKARFRAGEYCCEGKGNCLKAKGVL